LLCYVFFYVFCFFFFFQAEDGIRDLTVTGVQTCALPISSPFSMRRLPSMRPATTSGPPVAATSARTVSAAPSVVGPVKRTVRGRSEERRVGKECRSRWSGCQ